MITAIIPVRLSQTCLYDEVERIDRIAKTIPREFFQILIVDYGTPPERKYELQAVAEAHDLKIRHFDTQKEVFSIGRARDLGTQYAMTDLVIYHDIDFLMSTESYQRIFLETELREMKENVYRFFAVPGTYLSEQMTEKYLELHSNGRGIFADFKVHHAVMTRQTEEYENHTYAISAIVASRKHLLAIGGHNELFCGHGAEDFDLMHRLVEYNRISPRPANYYNNTMKNDITSYEGFRAQFAIHGIELFQRGIVFSHLWHPRRKDIGYVGTSNQKRIGDVLRQYDRNELHIEPIEDLTSEERTLVLGIPGSSPIRALRHSTPYLGRCSTVPESAFSSGEALVTFVREEGFDRVLFLNPYGNPHRLSLFDATNAANIPSLAFDRGALPDSWFFDDKGFLSNSDSYKNFAWNRQLSNDEIKRVANWREGFLREGKTLEDNGRKIGVDNLACKLGVGSRKVVFVALQRPSDTATRFFGGAVGSADNFNRWIEDLAKRIDTRRWCIVVKKHPLESTDPEMEGVIYAHPDTNIYELIELSSRVLVINSGVGLLAAVMGRSTICCGNAFYAHNGIAASCERQEDLHSLVVDGTPPDQKIVDKFLFHLVFHFYSFGKAKYGTKIEEGGSKIKIVNQIDFEVIRFQGREHRLGCSATGVSLDAPLFYSFGGRFAIASKIQKQNNKNVTAPASKSKHQNSSDQKLESKIAYQPGIRLMIFKSLAKPLLTSALWLKLDKNPEKYFVDSKSLVVRRIGKFVLRSNGR